MFKRLSSGGPIANRNEKEIIVCLGGIRNTMVSKELYEGEEYELLHAQYMGFFACNRRFVEHILSSVKKLLI